MNEAKQRIIKLSEFLKIEHLTIPTYQRPYKWSEKNVIQILEDIFESVIVKNKKYRIGNIILYKYWLDKDGKIIERNNYQNNIDFEEAIKNGSEISDIVDGQQRLTTISILLRIIDNNFDGLLLNQIYKHDISKNNIVYNYRIIDKWVNTKFGSEEAKKGLKSATLEKCEFVLFTVYQQDEAFQLFDSQNARGKVLEPYDLLKAFHLREMDFDSEDNRTKCVERWETAVDNGTLKPILGNHLFKIRKWSKNEWKYDFKKDDIEEFKGISLHKKQQFPYESAIRMLDGFIENAHNDKFLKNLQIAQTFPFQITMPLINGKRFFEYVDYYITQREKLFDFNKVDSIKAEMPEFAEFYKEYCYSYSGWGRSGDEKVRNLYENILIAFIDKFGYVDDFENFYKAFYKLAYEIRCNNKRISIESIMKSPTRELFTKINDSISPDAFKNYQYKIYDLKNERVNGIDKIVNFIKGFEFEKELENQIEKNGLQLKDDNDYYLIPFQYFGNEFHIYIGDKNNPYWYGFKREKEFDNEFKKIIESFKFQKSEKDWYGWKEVTFSTKEDIKNMIDEIGNWIKTINDHSN